MAQIVSPDPTAVGPVGNDFLVPALRPPRVAGMRRVGIAKERWSENNDDPVMFGDLEHSLGMSHVCLVRRPKVAGGGERLVASQVPWRIRREERIDEIDDDGIKTLPPAIRDVAPGAVEGRVHDH